MTIASHSAREILLADDRQLHQCVSTPKVEFMNRSARPLILLAFADPRRDLQNLKEESNGIRDIFWRFDDTMEVIILDHPTLEQILTTFRRNRGRVAAFHYAGHADSFRLLLETSAGDAHSAGATGFAQFLALQQGLHLVFLNGCSTKAQVEAIQAGEIPAVIATTRPINDKMATWFARQFYTSLTTGVNLQTAFAEATAAAMCEAGDQTRALYAEADDASEETTPLASPWQLHACPKRPEAAAWTLSRENRRRQRSLQGADAHETASLKNLDTLLRRVREFWVDGVLRSRQHQDGLLNIGKQQRPDAINNPWEAVISSTTTNESRVIEPGQTILDVFDDVHQSLLILGQPGSGKTTSMLELTQGLVNRAETEPNQPVPLILHLTTWAGESQTLQEWIASEVSEKYQIAARFVEQWLIDQRLILLLDGLDEIPEHLRLPCVNAIHMFMGTIGVPGIVVCCRTEEYAAIAVPLRVGGAVCLQPLSTDQILKFVSDGGQRTAALRKVLQTYEPLRNLAQSPLMLGIMDDAYRDADVINDAEFGSLESCQNHLFETYIDRMFQERPNGQLTFSRQQLLPLLTWLSRRMNDRNTAIFMVEDLQPADLVSGRAKFVYAALFALVLAGLSALAASVFWMSIAAISDDAATRLEMGLCGWLLGICFAWFGLISILESVPGLPFATGSGISNRRIVLQGTVKAFVLLMLWLLLMTPTFFMEPGEHGLTLFAPLLMTGTVMSLLMGAVGRRSRVMHDISSVEALGFSWRKAVQGGGMGALGGICIWLAFLFWGGAKIRFFWQSTATITTGNFVYLAGLLLLSVQVGAIFGGLVSTVVEKTKVNQGMRLSLKNALVVGSVTGVSFTITLLILLSVVVRPASSSTYVQDGFVFAGAAGLCAGYTAACWHGGLEVIKHGLLRLVLAGTAAVPIRIDRVLNEASRLKLLQRVGGGYMFLHRLLQEHLAKPR